MCYAGFTPLSRHSYVAQTRPPQLSRHSYVAQTHHIHFILADMADVQQKEAARNLKALKGHGPYDVLDVMVTCDCRWCKQGFTAVYGVVMVISWDTGEVHNCKVLSRNCSECARWADTDLLSDEYL